MALKKISLLGSTGSIGVQTLDVIRTTGCAEVAALSANNNIDLLEQQIIAFRPRLAVIGDEKNALELTRRLQSQNIKAAVLFGSDGLLAAASLDEADVLV
ncbi:MAG: 1-deoxy-D-xylulose-5-phosphate reductoisomerase, partial [Clostridiales bacterium]|nr:1-deoxy-D-xylulose-5-phosphate reductoisomerase [Clostridiales bacterium]